MEVQAHVSHVDRCSLSASSIHSFEVSSFGTYFNMCERQGTADPVSILCDSLENHVFATSMMKANRVLCFSSLVMRYCFTNSGDPRDVPRILIPSFAGHTGSRHKFMS